jgi:hypothetical protein
MNNVSVGATTALTGRFTNVTLTTGNLIVASGQGIDFSATSHPAGMTSELLADYEEGTWTPSAGAGLTVIGTFSSGGNYTKIGNIVYLQGYVAGATSVAFANGGATICGGLPYSASSASPLQVGLGIDANNTTSAPLFAYNSNILSSGTFAATAQYHFSVFYRI